MNRKTLVIISIIVGFITLALSFISSSDRFDIDIPYYICVAPSVLWCIIILPALANKKSGSDKG